MNRNRYRLVFNPTLSMMVPVAETTRGRGKAASGPALALVGVLIASSAQAELPVPSANFAVPGTVASYHTSGNQAYIDQVGNKAIVNFQTANMSAGTGLTLSQVDSLTARNLVPDARFTVLARIHDQNPTTIAGSISQAPGQQANLIMVNSNGIAFLSGSQVNLSSFTASTLNIADDYIYKTLLPEDGLPQFDKALDGTEGRGFIKVFENARITASNQGRVMLIAPTVINKGKIEAKDGQVVLAAGSKVFLRSASAFGDSNVRGLLVEVDSPASLDNYDTPIPDDANDGVKNGMLDNTPVSLQDTALDKLGHATNLGELTAERGNVTMVGYAVNQQGIARATTSVVANGSVYLLAQDRAQIPAATKETEAGIRSERAGRVTLAASSVTEVLPDIADKTGAQDGASGQDLVKRSQVRILGQDVRMEGGALINAPSGEVRFIAVDRPSDLNVSDALPTYKDPFTMTGVAASDTARIHIADGARIQVAGLENVEISAARNSVEVELRGDQLKDSPVNREGPLKGEKAYVDINRALANANAGKSTLISKDSLTGYQALLERGVAERSTQGGKVTVHSQGEAILESGAVVDLSGGSVKYTADTLKTTLLAANGKVVDLADANAETRYDGIATRYVREFKRWNRKEVIDLGQSYRYDPGYFEGKDAGALEIIGLAGTVLQAEMIGRTTVGELQRETGQTPAGARLQLGYNGGGDDYKLNQQIEISSTAALLPKRFGFGDTLPGDLKTTLAINPASIGQDKIAQLEVFSNQAAAVREAMRTSNGGSIKITAQTVNVGADVIAPGGEIAFNADANTVATAVPSNVLVGPGVTLSARGEWINQLPGAGGNASTGDAIDGGNITLSAVNDVVLEEGTHIDVTGGGRVKPDGKIAGGKGGAITLEANARVEKTNPHNGGVRLSGELSGYGLGEGGSLTISSGKIQIGGAADTSPGVLNLDSGFFSRGGFSNIVLTGSDGLTVADGVSLAPVVQTLELQPGATLQASGSRIEGFTQRVVLDPRLRKPVNLTLSANTYAAGDVRIGEGARIDLDDKATLAINAGHRIEVLGQIRARGGDISAELRGSLSEAFDPASAIWLGKAAVLDASGVARTYTDSRGLTRGEVLSGGKVALKAQTGFVVTAAGSQINVSGAVPVRLDVPNEAGGLGRMVGSDAGAVSIAAREGVALDGTLLAGAGSALNRGGAFGLALGNNDSANGAGFTTGERVITLANTTPLQATGLVPGAAIPTTLEGQAKLGATALEAAGFDRIALNSRDAIRLEDGLNIGAGRAVPLREVTLDTPRIETAGGDATLRAATLRLGNYDTQRQATVNTPAAGTGTLRASASLMELAGNQTFTGMARTELTGEREIRLGGVSVNDARPTGSLTSAADLMFHGAVVAPATYVQHTISAPGRTVEFTRNTNSPVQPLSALGSVKIEADKIVQGGNLWAPFGQIDFKAGGALVFKDGSLTSVAAAPGSLTPFGRTVNGRDWSYTVGGNSIDQEHLNEKAIRTEGATIDMQAGAKIDLAGGGDLQAYEFTVGPGGSSDILTDKNTYAILPGQQRGFAPIDAQESFNRPSGESVYLSGVPGLADGVYTLLPAHYALLPGAYAVKLNSGIKDVMPGYAYSRQDGVRIAAGYVTDSRAQAPRDARWQGIEVLTRDQVRARSEFALTNASAFFADTRTRPQDAGLLSIATTGSGADAVKLDALYNLAGAPGGRGAKVDLSAAKLAIVSGSPSGIDPDAVQIDVAKLNALDAGSLLLGATRAMDGDTTTLTVGAESVTLANDVKHALKASEVMLAARDTLTLKAGSAIDAQGDAGDAGAYETAGDGAFVRAASTTATFSRTGSPDRSQGTLTGEAGSTIIAADSVILDATKTNDYKGTASFAKNGVKTAGNLGVGATRINFGAAGAAEGITYSQAELDALDLEALTLTSYSTFDLYGDVSVGRLDKSGKPVLQKLTLQGAGLAGADNAGQSAQINAQHLTLVNPSASPYTPGGTLGSGSLEITANTLTLGQGDKEISGYSKVTVNANELLGAGVGKTTIAAPATFNVSRISGGVKSAQTLSSTGKLDIAKRTADPVLAAVNTLGAKWALAGTSVDFSTQAVLKSGEFKLTATNGNVSLGANADIDVAGRDVAFFEVSQPSWGGTAEFVSENGDVSFAAGSTVDVSAAKGGDAGTLIVRAAQGRADFADASIVKGVTPPDANGKRGEGARVLIDTGSLASFSSLNTVLNSGGFDGERILRVRSGDVNVASTDKVTANNIHISADAGKLNVAGWFDASGEDAGRIELFAKKDVNVLAGAQFYANSSGAGEDGGDIEIGSTEGSLNFASSTMKVQGGSGGAGGTVRLRALRTGPVDAETNLAVKAFDATGTEITTNALGSVGINGTLTGARSISVEAVKVYDNVATLTAVADNSAGNLGLDKVTVDNAKFAGNDPSKLGANHAAIRTRLGETGDPALHILSGVEVRAPGDLTLRDDWNLATSRAVETGASLPTSRTTGEAGVLTLRAQGNLNIDSNLSDGFNVATAQYGSDPATLNTDDSWAYRLVAGADSAAANVMAVKPGDKNFTLAAGKLIRTGTGDIRIASGRDIKLGGNTAAIYSAGRAADALANFTAPDNAQFSQGGGDIVLAALGDITSPKRSLQLYSNWLFRQGSLTADKSAYAVQPAWWVRFDQFQQGVGALGGGDVSLLAGSQVENVSASTPTQARMDSLTPNAVALHKTGGGSVRVETGGDLLGGQYYADNGEIVIRSGGKIDEGELANTGTLGRPVYKTLYTLLALGDAQAKVRANEDVNIHAVLNPHLVLQSSSADLNTNVNISGFQDPTENSQWSVFSTYSEKSGVELESLSGMTTLHNAVASTPTEATLSAAYRSLKFGGGVDMISTLPPGLLLTAFQSDISLKGTVTMSPASRGNLALLAANNVNIPGRLTLSDTGPLPDAVSPGTDSDQFTRARDPKALFAHAVTPVHAGDPEPVRIYAVDGDVSGKANTFNLKLSKPAWVKAGKDVVDLGIEIQHLDATSVSRIEAGRDVQFSSSGKRNSDSYIWVGGPGRLEVTAGRDVDLGTSAGIVSRGGLDNPALPVEGAAIHVAAGVGAGGVDYAGAVARLVAALKADPADDASLWQARWFTDNDSLAAGDALAAVEAVGADAQRERVRAMLFIALRTTGRDSNDPASAFAGDYARGYAALETVFPGINAKHADGSAKYQGGVNLFASRIKTENGGDIEFLIPGGDLIVGLSNTSATLLDTTDPLKNKDFGALGIVTVAPGNIKGFARDDILVNQSRILTVSGGDVLLWSSEGDIDAGKGKKTATSVPPPILEVKSDGTVIQRLQGAATGSGIGALYTSGFTAGDVDLVAPKGAVNAGDAGIRAGNLNIAAQVVIGADNITASGTSTGTPVADTSAVSAASSGASNADGGVSDATKALSQGLSEAARVAEELKQSFKPTFISAEVIGHGDCEPGEKPPCKKD